jgi:hypothetical protein
MKRSEYRKTTFNLPSNDVMHFETAGIDPEQMNDIQQMADYLKNLMEYLERGKQKE